MNGPRDPETTIANWLDEGPDRLPPITRQVVISSIHVTPQRHRPRAWPAWFSFPSTLSRYPAMSTYLRVAVASILAIVAGGFLYGGFPAAPVSAPAAPSSPAPALATSPATLVAVEGTGSCDDAVGGTTTASHGLTTTLGATLECTSETNEPRVNGTWAITWNHAQTGTSPDIWWGTGLQDGPDGAWECSWSLTDNPRTASYPILNICRGSGSYDGLTYVFQHVMGGGDQDVVLGYIYEGQPLGEWVPATP